MAIKGKRKSKGGQARRPTPAPRVPVSGRGRTPWYQTSGGRVFIASMIVLLIAGIAGTVAIVASESDTGPRRDALTRYTASLRELVQSIAPIAGEMQQSGAIDPKAEEFAALEDKSEEWLEALTETQAQAARISPPGGLTGANNLIFQAINTYNSAARTFGIAPQAEGRLAREILNRATETFGTAEALFGSAVGFLDEERAAIDLTPTGISPPSIAAASLPQPTPSPSVSVVPSESPAQGGADDKTRKGKGKGRRDGDGNGKKNGNQGNG